MAKCTKGNPPGWLGAQKKGGGEISPAGFTKGFGARLQISEVRRTARSPGWKLWQRVGWMIFYCDFVPIFSFFWFWLNGAGGLPSQWTSEKSDLSVGHHRLLKPTSLFSGFPYGCWSPPCTPGEHLVHGFPSVPTWKHIGYDPWPYANTQQAMGSHSFKVVQDFVHPQSLSQHVLFGTSYFWSSFPYLAKPNLNQTLKQIYLGYQGPLWV